MPGIERPRVRRDVEHARVGVEDGLGAVAVVHVEVHDQHALEAPGEGVGRGHRHVVEEAEAHGPVGQRRGGRAGAPRRRRGPGRRPGPRSTASTTAPAARSAASYDSRAGLGVGVEAIAASRGGGHVGQVARGVDPQQLRRGRRARGHHPQLRLEARPARCPAGSPPGAPDARGGRGRRRAFGRAGRRRGRRAEPSWRSTVSRASGSASTRAGFPPHDPVRAPRRPPPVRRPPPRTRAAGTRPRSLPSWSPGRWAAPRHRPARGRP